MSMGGWLRPAPGPRALASSPHPVHRLHAGPIARSPCPHKGPCGYTRALASAPAAILSATRADSRSVQLPDLARVLPAAYRRIRATNLQRAAERFLLLLRFAVASLSRCAMSVLQLISMRALGTWQPGCCCCMGLSPAIADFCSRAWGVLALRVDSSPDLH